MRTVVHIMWIPMLLALLYLGWVFWERHSENSALRPASKPDNPLAKFGSAVQILQFYAGTARIPNGGTALLCYGVVNAVAVHLDPPVEQVWPSMSRCFDVHPNRTTRYTLTAEGAGHQSVSESLQIVVAGGS